MHKDQSNFYIFIMFITLYKKKPHLVFVGLLFWIQVGNLEIESQSIIFLIDMWLFHGLFWLGILLALGDISLMPSNTWNTKTF